MSLMAIERHNIGVILIDVQPIFLESAFHNDQVGEEPIMVRLEQLLILTNWLELPIIATFEHPVDQNGELPERLERAFPTFGNKFTKLNYGCTLEPTIRAAIKRLPVTAFAIAGAETDVCVLQSVLGLLRMGYGVFLLEDCLFTSEPHPGPALRRMYAAGATPCTLKSMAYELGESENHTPWLSNCIDREASFTKPFPAQFVKPEAFPPWKPVI